jgi:subtilisin family serine protease
MALLRDRSGGSMARPKKARTRVRLNRKQRQILERQREKFPPPYKLEGVHMSTESKPQKKRFLVAHRYGPRLDPKASSDLESFVASHEGVALARKTRVGRCVVEMTPDQMRALASSNADLVIEEDEKLELFGMPGLPFRLVPEGSYALSVKVSDSTTGKPVADVTVYGIGSGPAYKAVTDENGAATLHTVEASLRRVVASPRDTYWSRVVEDVSVEPEKALEVALKPLLANGAYDWGARMMGFRQAAPNWTGKGVKIAIVDTGVTDRHGDLRPKGGYNALDGQDPKAWNVDEKGHGTHVAGIAGARNNRIGVLGGAPDAEIHAVKVFPGGHLSDLVEAIEWCIRAGIDVISMSLGSPDPSRILAGVLRDAYDRGIVCIAAAGNERTRVAYPAAFPTVVGVGAIGRFGTFPEDSAHATQVSRYRDRRGGLFAAGFSNAGPEIDICAPGVAILSTVPSGYAAWDGTSMACPLVSSVVALALQAYPSIRTGDDNQSESVRTLLHQAAADLGMPPTLQGHGLPLVPRILPTSRPRPAFARAG